MTTAKKSVKIFILQGEHDKGGYDKGYYRSLLFESKIQEIKPETVCLKDEIGQTLIKHSALSSDLKKTYYSFCIF